MEQVFTVLGWLVLVTLTLGIARQLSSQPTIYMLPSEFATYGQEKGLLENFSPAETTDPYSLLQNSKLDLGNLTAQTCYEKNFVALSQKTGNYIQRTNNYKHEAPAACTAPLTQLEGAAI